DLTKLTVPAEQTRGLLWNELADERTVGVGAHFPELQLGRVTTRGTRCWAPVDTARRGERRN
ncbi:MAG: hypothetical protein ACRDRE_02790, partial [Pseudonocardiaceae bacterium]